MQRHLDGIADALRTLVAGSAIDKNSGLGFLCPSNIVDAKAMLYNTLGLPMQLHLDGLAYAAHTTCCCRTP